MCLPWLCGEAAASCGVDPVGGGKAGMPLSCFALSSYLETSVSWAILSSSVHRCLDVARGLWGRGRVRLGVLLAAPAALEISQTRSLSHPGSSV